jgi:hypothetical protein
MGMVSVSGRGDVIAVGIIAVVASQLRGGLQQHRLHAGPAGSSCWLPGLVYYLRFE